MKNIILKWKVAKKPNKVIQKTASHYTFRTCTEKCGS